MATNSIRTREGHPNNWPRKLARRHLFAIDAVAALLEKMDEMNARFALTEFVEEREKMQRIHDARVVRAEGAEQELIFVRALLEKIACAIETIEKED